MTGRRAMACVLVAVAALTGPGCGGYVLRGKVVQGPQAGAWNVTPDDPRLEAYGLAGASIDLVLDPRSLGRKVLGRYLTDHDGRFSVPVDVLGAGFLEDEFGLVVRQNGFRTVEQTIMLPPSGRYLLVIMMPGADTYQPPEDPLREARQYLNQ